MSFHVPSVVRHEFASPQFIPAQVQSPANKMFVNAPSPASTQPSPATFLSMRGNSTSMNIPQTHTRTDIRVVGPMTPTIENRMPLPIASMSNFVVRQSSTTVFTSPTSNGGFRESSNSLAVSQQTPRPSDYRSISMTPVQGFRQVSASSISSSPSFATSVVTDPSVGSPVSPKLPTRQVSVDSLASTHCESMGASKALPTLLTPSRTCFQDALEDRDKKQSKPTGLVDAMLAALEVTQRSVGKLSAHHAQQPIPQTIPEDDFVESAIAADDTMKNADASVKLRTADGPTCACTALKEAQSMQGHARQINWLETMLQQMVTEYEKEFAAKEKLDAKDASWLEKEKERQLAAKEEVDRRISLRLSREAQVAQNKVVAEEEHLRRIKSKQELEVAREQRVAEDKKVKRAESARRYCSETARKDAVRKEGQRLLQEKVATFAERHALKRSKSDMIASDALRIHSARRQTNPLVSQLYESMKAVVSEQRARNVCDSKALRDHVERLVLLAEPSIS